MKFKSIFVTLLILVQAQWINPANGSRTLDGIYKDEDDPISMRPIPADFFSDEQWDTLNHAYQILTDVLESLPMQLFRIMSRL
jgi:hypothetical protein